MSYPKTLAYIVKFVKCPKYLFHIIPSSKGFYDTRRKQRLFSIAELIVSSILFLEILCLNGHNLRLEIQNLESIAVFKSNFLSFIRPSKRSIFNVNDPEVSSILFLEILCLNGHNVRLQITCV